MELFIPGRICLFGEHSDWAASYRTTRPEIEKGHALIVGTDQGIHARAEPHEDALILTSAAYPEGRSASREIPMRSADLLEEARRGGFWSYVAGVAYQILQRHRVSGLRLDNDRTDLPVKKGLSSSAAICVLTARAFNTLYDLRLSFREEMELAYLGETTTPSRCGRMDQACVFGRRPTLLTFDGEDLLAEGIPPGGCMHLLLVDLRAQKNTVRILEQLNRLYPSAEGELARGLHKLLGPINRRMVTRAAEALRAGDGERIGALMREAQELFDRYAAPACPEELTAPVLHRVLTYPPLQPHLWGGKGVGSQGDGTAQLVARSAPDRQKARAMIENDLKLGCLDLTIAPQPEQGRI